MKKLLLPTVIWALVLSACSGSQPTATAATCVKPTARSTDTATATIESTATAEAAPTPASTDSAPASKEIVERWIAAYQDRDAAALLSLYADNVTWLDCSTSSLCDAYYLGTLKLYVPRDFSNPRFELEIQSNLVTTSGRFAALQAMYTDPNAGVSAAPTTVILEITHGLISNETWYYAVP
jgi:hypothetical protein